MWTGSVGGVIQASASPHSALPPHTHTHLLEPSQHDEALNLPLDLRQVSGQLHLISLELGEVPARGGGGGGRREGGMCLG